MVCTLVPSVGRYFSGEFRIPPQVCFNSESGPGVVSSVYLIALSVGLENHHPLDLSDRWIYQELRARWRRFIQLERPHGERIGLRLLQSEFTFHAYVAMLGTFDSNGEVTLTLLEKPHWQLLGSGMPFFFVSSWISRRILPVIKGHPCFDRTYPVTWVGGNNNRPSIWYNKRWNKASMHSRTLRDLGLYSPIT